jgi:integration host factor subunit alpha
MTTTLTKAELADLLFAKVGLNKREAKDMVEAFFEEIRLQLEQGESEEIPITARRVVTFHPSQKLKTMVEKSYHGKPQA